MDISIVVPVYNGEKTLEALHSQIVTFCEAEQLKHEIIFINDCGPDNSLTVLKKLKEAFPEHIKVIELTRNYGQHNAIIAGFTACSGEMIITMDEDLQHQPKDIKRLLSKQKEGDYDVVYGVNESLEHSRFRNITSRILKKVLSYAIENLHKEYSAFRLIKRDIALQLVGMRNSYTFLDGYLSWITNNVGSTRVEHKERFAGESSYTTKKLVEHSINILFTFSNIPIRILSYSSILIFFITLIYSVYIVVRKLIYDDLIAGFPTLIIAVGIGVSFLLLGLGIIGEYTYRINLKTTKRPNYTIKK
ncbi:glycosyltransferase family 2 protein [Kordia sp. YSTF-M3]|uniref:Glycosyltransferase family 2 protein n=1 Tax=Kordia aestuariivivens TaxID=2759037 RepID=A0ABR7Q9A8_9FLAO|nr:glycosyltransferase family 2 protein [Kordia aestuariivivens]MBC8755141.1 glycosyltransferase family 2 protein [Kordia aestuariivivens]